MELLSETTIRQLLNLNEYQMLERETERQLDNRIVEFLTLENHQPRKVLIKYGTDADLFNKEFLYYRLLRMDAVRVPVPYILKQLSNGLFFLAIEWLDGEHPRFDNETHVKKVYEELGKWAVYYYGKVNDPLTIDKWGNDLVWLEIENEFKNLYKEMVHLFTRIPKMIHSFVDTYHLKHEESDLEMIDRIPMIAKNLANSILELPSTLDPSDMTSDNIILCQDGRVGFIDFQGIGLKPVSLMFTSIGEPWDWLPNGRFAEHAMRSFIEIWNKFSDEKITWETFYSSYYAARVYFKCSLLEEWFCGNEMDEYLVQYANGFITDLIVLLRDMNFENQIAVQP